ncbi:TIGR00269 family protein [Marinithermus hydrothermalis]|uniref:PP-loop domain protein n=1 Tax=Marinithermus hydrothermalis (strain DSM 14884 / JCM 11576 / T1) TaxID=869210 RepID=F2NLX0_MARHT|nr:TIGR00269 family protein [Marinithermus hydrothermalis]AEB11227.1 PP-loop domain protein [Marinithermus hydrothermalis DSM 14884]
MRCRKCTQNAQVELRRHGLALCAAHYLEWFEAQTARAIRRHKMIREGDRVLVAISGGKDSLALWEVLTRLGYEATGLHIQLGIGEYSERAYEVTTRFARERGLPLIVVDLAESYGLGVPELSLATGRVACSGCGLSKRYLMNEVAREEGFNVVATGHNLDDEAAVLLGNVLRWQTDALPRQGPVLPEREGLARRIKPFYLFTEREVASYALLRRIAYQHEECPNATGAKSLLYKEALNRLEERMPGTKQAFLEQFLKKIQPILAEGLGAQEVALKECERCGAPTTGETCAFCRLWDQAYRRAKKRKLLPESRAFEPRPRARRVAPEEG